MKRAYSNNLFETGNTIIPKTMKNLGLLKEYKKNQIFYKWGDIVGKEIEKHISPQEINFAVLYVYANSSVWANNFQYLKIEIIEKINDFLDEGYTLNASIEKAEERRQQLLVLRRFGVEIIKDVEITDRDKHYGKIDLGKVCNDENKHAYGIVNEDGCSIEIEKEGEE